MNFPTTKKPIGNFPALNQPVKLQPGRLMSAVKSGSKSNVSKALQTFKKADGKKVMSAAAFERMDKKADVKHGIKEDSKKDLKSDKPMMKKQGKKDKMEPMLNPTPMKKYGKACKTCAK